MAKINHEIGPYIMPYLLEWRKKLRMEERRLEKRMSILKGQLRTLDKEIADSKKQHGREATLTKHNIDKRKQIQEGDLDQLEWQIYSVKRRSNPLDTAIEEAIQLYARSSCYAFTTMVYQVLPREVRDMCYDHLLDPQSVKLIGDAMRYQIKHYSCNCPKGPIVAELAHYLDLTFIPTVVSNEILKVAGTKFSYDQEAASVIESDGALSTMRAMSVEPLTFNFVRDIKFRLWLKSIFRRWERNEGKRVDDFLMPEWVAYIRESLLSIPVRRDGSLTIEFVHYSIPKTDIEGFRDIMEPVFAELKTRGFKMVDIYWIVV